LGAIKAVGIVEDLIEIWPNEVCDKMNPVKEERQTRRAEDRARHHIDNSNHYHYHHHPLLQNIPSAPVWNRGRGGRHYLSFRILFPTIFLIILHFKISLLLLFGIEKEEKDIISLLYMFLQTWMKP